MFVYRFDEPNLIRRIHKCTSVFCGDGLMISWQPWILFIIYLFEVFYYDTVDVDVKVCGGYSHVHVGTYKMSKKILEYGIKFTSYTGFCVKRKNNLF